MAFESQFAHFLSYLKKKKLLKFGNNLKEANSVTSSAPFLLAGQVLKMHLNVCIMGLNFVSDLNGELKSLLSPILIAPLISGPSDPDSC